MSYDEWASGRDSLHWASGSSSSGNSSNGIVALRHVEILPGGITPLGASMDTRLSSAFRANLRAPIGEWVNEESGEEEDAVIDEEVNPEDDGEHD